MSKQDETAPLYREGIPDTLLSRDQWLMWDKSADTPRRPHKKGDFSVSWSDPDQWLPFEAAADRVERVDSWGLGYVTAYNNDEHPMGIVSVIDIDGGIDENGELKDWVPSLEDFLQDDRYIEHSPSRDEHGDSGLHIPVVGGGDQFPDWFRDVHFADDEHEGVDLLTNKFCTVTGDRYEGAGDELARWADDYVHEWLQDAYEAVTGEEPSVEETHQDGSDTSDDEMTSSGGEHDVDEEMAREMLGAIDPDCSYSRWRNVGFGLSDHFVERTARRLFRKWSRQGTKFDDDAERFIEDIASRGSGDRTIGTVWYYAEQEGWEPPSGGPAGLETPTAKELVARESDEFDSPDEVPDDWFRSDDEKDREHPAPDELQDELEDVDRAVVEFGDEVSTIIYEFNEDIITRSAARHQIANALTRCYDFVRPEEAVRGWRDTLYVYNPREGIYEPRGETFIKQKLEHAATEFVTNQATNEVVEKVARMSYERGDQFRTDPNCLVVNNGILDLHTGEIEEFTPKEYHRTKIPVDWNPDAGEPDAIDEFVHEIVKPADVPTLYRVIAHALYKEYVTEKAAMLVGSGQNGKSVFLDFVERFLGEWNVSHRALQAFQDDFKANQLQGKLANIHPDMGDDDVKDMSMFKKLTGRDTLLADVKYEKPIEFENFATMVFAANELPTFSEDNHAIWRRWVYIDFPHTFDPTDPSAKNPRPKQELLDELTAEEELEALLVRCQQEIQRWHEGDQWYPDSMEPEQVREKMKKAAEPVYAFATTCLEAAEDEEAYLPKDVVRAVYNAYADTEDLGRIPENEFGQRLLSLRDFPIESTQRRVDGRRRRVYNGISLSSRGEQLLVDDAKDDGAKRQGRVGDDYAQAEPLVLERARTIVDDTGEPIERDKLAYTFMGNDDVTIDEAKHAIGKLEQKGELVDVGGGVAPNN